MEDLDPVLTYATQKEAKAAAKKDLDARRNRDAKYRGKRFVLGWSEANGWTEVEGGEDYECFGVTDETGEQMLGNDGEWYTVA